MKGTKGSIRKRGSGFQGRVDIGPDPLTGKRRVRYVSLAKKGALQEKIAEILAELGKGEYIDPRKITFGEWLDTWYDTAVEGSKRPRTCERYRGIIDNHLKPALGAIVLQKLQAVDIEKYFRESTQSSTSLVIHLVVISSALDSARRKKILTHNEAELIDNRPRPKKGTNDIAENCWTADEARRFLDVARDEGPQAHAFYSLELGSRKSELGGLLWKDVDLEAGTLLLEHQLAKSSTLEFVPLKSG